jgi:hypothetical protein
MIKILNKNNYQYLIKLKNEVKSYSKIKDNNSFIFIEYNNEDYKYENYLYNNDMNLYEDIKDKAKIKILFFLFI